MNTITSLEEVLRVKEKISKEISGLDSEELRRYLRAHIPQEAKNIPIVPIPHEAKKGRESLKNLFRPTGT